MDIPRPQRTIKQVAAQASCRPPFSLFLKEKTRNVNDQPLKGTKEETLEGENACLKEENEKLKMQAQYLRLQNIGKKVEREKRRQEYLAFAEKVMCRCLMLIFLFSFFPYCQPPEQFYNLTWHRYFYGIGGFTVFFVVWIYHEVTGHNQNEETTKTEDASAREVRPVANQFAKFRAFAF